MEISPGALKTSGNYCNRRTVQSETQHSELKLLLTRLILRVVNTSAAARQKQAPLTT